MQDIVPSGNTHSDTCVVSPVTSRVYTVQGCHVGGGSQSALLLCPARGKRGTRFVPHRHSFEALSTHSKWPIKHDLWACSGLHSITQPQPDTAAASFDVRGGCEVGDKAPCQRPKKRRGWGRAGVGAQAAHGPVQHGPPVGSTVVRRRRAFRQRLGNTPPQQQQCSVLEVDGRRGAKRSTLLVCGQSKRESGRGTDTQPSCVSCGWCA
jgi:hypothetical protein